MTTLEAALWYVAQGWRVLPLWPVVRSGDRWRCLCRLGTLCGRASGKHPSCHGGVLDATADPARVRAGWEYFANAHAGVEPGVGVATGAGLLVIDLDAPALGEEHWRALTDAGPRIHTVESLTGRGRHLWFRAPGLSIPSSAGRLGSGIDVRAEGGYVVAPPTRHVSGRVYGWEASSDPTDGVALAAAPAWLVALALRPSRRDVVRAPTRERIQTGARNDALMRHACGLRARGLELVELHEAVARFNAQFCDPPVLLREVRGLVRGVCRRYPAGASNPVREAIARAEAQAERSLRAQGNYAFRDDVAWWLASMDGVTPEDPERL